MDKSTAPIVPDTAPAPSSFFQISPAQLTMMVVCLVSVYFIVGFYGKSLESYRINQREAQVRQEVARLEQKNGELRAQVAYLSTDAYVETAARDKLNLVRPGDHALVMVQAQAEQALVPAPPPADPSASLREFGHLAQWLALFFGSR